MKFKRNAELSLSQRHDLIQGLSEVAEFYFDDLIEYGKDVNFNCGICAALHSVDVPNPYSTMDKLMQEMGDNYYDNYLRIETKKEWEPRAYMCLFLIEYLKDTIK
jgi:hypothetical protein